MVGMDAAVLLAAIAAGTPAPPPPPRPEPSSGPARTVGAAVRRAHLAEAITWRQRRMYERTLVDAKAAARRLPPLRAREIKGSLTVARRLAARGELGAERLAPVMAGIRASSTVFRLQPYPAPAERRQVDGDGLVYEFRPGAGMQVHPLASAGRLNALAGACLHERREARCRPAALTRAADALAAVGVRDGDRVRMEYMFGFGRGRAPWTSAMAQATSAQALARAGRVTGSRRHARTASAVYRALVGSSTSVRGPDGRVARFAMYSFQPQMRVLNGELQTVVGLADYARLSGRRDARRVLRRTARGLAGSLEAWDTGAWTLYNSGGREATLHYHQLAADFAARACRQRIARKRFCRPARAFARYTREPPRLTIRVERVVRTGRRVKVVLRASKGASGRLVARGPRGSVQARAVDLGRRPVAVRFAAARSGRWRLTVSAVAVNGKRGTAGAAVLARPKPKRTRRTLLRKRRVHAERRESAERRARAERRAKAERRARAERRAKAERRARAERRAKAERRARAERRAKAERRRRAAARERIAPPTVPPAATEPAVPVP